MAHDPIDDADDETGGEPATVLGMDSPFSQPMSTAGVDDSNTTDPALAPLPKAARPDEPLLEAKTMETAAVEPTPEEEPAPAADPDATVFDLKPAPTSKSKPPAKVATPAPVKARPRLDDELGDQPTWVREPPPDLESSATLMLDRSAIDAKAVPGHTSPSLKVEEVNPGGTLLLDASALPQPKAAKPVSKAGAFSRKPGDGQAVSQEELAGRTSEGLVPFDSFARRRVQLVIAGLVLVIAVILIVALSSSDKPSVEQLQLAYPYGFEGAGGPKGEEAPGAADVQFKYLDEVTCPAYLRCVRYQYSRDDFSGTLTVGKQPDGRWVRASDEGMPFRARVKP